MYHALLDTGASRSYIGEKLYQELNKLKIAKLNPVRLMARFADSRSISILGTIDLEMFFMGKVIKAQFRVLPKLDADLLFGLDILSAVDYEFKFPHVSILRENDENKELEAALEAIRIELDLFKNISGVTNVGEHVIRLKPGTAPISFSYAPRNPMMQKVITDHAIKMENDGVIERANSGWCSPIVIAKRKDKTYRFCNDYRKINSVSERDIYPVPQVNATLDKLRNSKFFSKIDLKNGYWNIPLAVESRPITAFFVPGRGMFQYKVMPFGLHSASATFQRTVETVLGPELGVSVSVYLDDVIVLGKTVPEHLERVRRVLRRLRNANLRVNTEKSEFFKTEIRYLGHVINAKGISTDPDKIESILAFTEPRNITELRRFMGIISWYRRFLPDCSSVAKPLTELLKKKRKWQWGQEQTAAFLTLKERLTSAPILAVPDFNEPFCLQTDASKHGLGAVLTQVQNGGEVIIAYASRTLNKAELNYSVTEKECLAVVWGISKMRYYLEGYKFTVLTDHVSLKWLQTLQSPAGRVARWSIYLQQFEFEIKYRKGSQNRVADALSRDPLPHDDVTDDVTDETVFSISENEQCQWYRELLKATIDHPDRHPEYSVQNGLLYRHLHHSLNFTDRDKAWKLCVPKTLRSKVLTENHDDPTAGHLGIGKTIARISQNYFWPGMNGDIAKYVRQCESCQRYKSPQTAVPGKMGSCNATHPWEIVSMDIVGPLTRSSRGHKYLLVMQDKFTKWVEIQAIREQKTRPIVQIFKERIILRYGCPRILITDNGSQFRANDFASMIKGFGITHQRTPPYSPQCNPVERTNKTVKTIIAQYVKENQRSWDTLLPEFQFALNTALHESTQFTPAYLNFQREILPPNTLKSSVEGNTCQRPRLVENLNDTIELVKVNLARAFTKQSKHYDRKRRDWAPSRGEMIAKREHPLSSAIDNFSAKLAPKYSGKYIVTDFIGEKLLEVQDSDGRKSIVHVKDVKPYYQEGINIEGVSDPIDGKEVVT